MGAGHSHNHGCTGTATRRRDFGRAFAIGVLLNSAFVLIEAGFGLWSGSMALVADAGHNLSDVISLLIAWGAAYMAARPANSRFTYGYKSSSILAALANAGLLLVALGAILFETIDRLFDPAPVEGWTMIAVAGVGIVVNGATALLFARGRKHDINIRGAFLHMAADALVSVGVVVAGVAILLTGERLIDPLTSLVIVAIIGFGHLGAAQGQRQAGAARGARLDRRERGARLPGRAAGRRRGARPAHLADEHDRDRAHRAPGDAAAAIPATPSCARSRTSSSTASTSAMRPCRSRPAHEHDCHLHDAHGTGGHDHG